MVPGSVLLLAFIAPKQTITCNFNGEEGERAKETAKEADGRKRVSLLLLSVRWHLGSNFSPPACSLPEPTSSTLYCHFCFQWKP